MTDAEKIKTLKYIVDTLIVIMMDDLPTEAKRTEQQKRLLKLRGHLKTSMPSQHDG